jgi:hypothetical protein
MSSLGFFECEIDTIRGTRNWRPDSSRGGSMSSIRFDERRREWALADEDLLYVLGLDADGALCHGFVGLSPRRRRERAASEWWDAQPNGLIHSTTGLRRRLDGSTRCAVPSSSARRQRPPSSPATRRSQSPSATGPRRRSRSSSGGLGSTDVATYEVEIDGGDEHWRRSGAELGDAGLKMAIPVRHSSALLIARRIERSRSLGPGEVTST